MKLRQQGFTLIEIAIVLVIIGLLLGGVLKGQELINSAKVRSLNNRVDGIAAAWFGFQDRYRALPGDYADAQNNIPAGTVAIVNGDGDGQIEGGATASQVWVQLAAAGFISGSYEGNDVPLNNYACPTIDCPDNGFGRGMVISFDNEGRTNAGNANELLTGANIPSEILAELDRKIDDGTATSGTMQLGAGGTGWGGGAAAACLNGTDYQVLTPSENCAAVFRNL